MAISLEVKKFVNTEYVGKFAEIELPIAQPEDEEPPRKARKKPDKKDKKEKKASFIRKRADYDGDDDDYDDNYDVDTLEERQRIRDSAKEDGSWDYDSDEPYEGW